MSKLESYKEPKISLVSVQARIEPELYEECKIIMREKKFDNFSAFLRASLKVIRDMHHKRGK